MAGHLRLRRVKRRGDENEIRIRESLLNSFDKSNQCQGFEDYREDLGTIKDYFSDDELNAEANKRLNIWFRWAKGGIIRAESIKVTATIAVRGTEYLIQRYPDDSVEVWVLDGEVELTFPSKSESLIVKAGYRCSFNENGPSAPVPFDTVERWWEK